MTAKEFLSQARHLDARINAKLEQVARLRAMLTRGVQTLSLTPKGGPADWSETVGRILELEAEINGDIDALVALKRRIARAIEANPGQRAAAGRVTAGRVTASRALLEMRYLSGWSWRRIAREMNYSERQVWRLHAQALEQFVVPEEEGE